jgi:2-desacetyl-2-hydroxyethyl bacteriochlorophyllide A dehydrogenase
MDVPVPEIGLDEVLVETRSSGICGTDLHILQGTGYVPVLPHILGHEPAGVVAQVGQNVSDINIGDRVVPSLFFCCNRCYYCRVGRHQQCAQLKGILGVHSPGAFAEYFKVPAQNLFQLPDAIGFDAGGLIADAVVTAIHAAKRGILTSGSRAVVIGMGGVGLCLLQALVAGGIRTIAVEKASQKLGIARELGAERAVEMQEEIDRTISKWAKPDGIQCVFDCVGSRQTLDLSCRIVMNGGRVVIVGEQDDYSSVTSTEIAQRELEIVGSRNGTRQDMVEAIRMVERGEIKPIISSRFPLEQINQAIQRLREGVVGRIVIEISNDWRKVQGSMNQQLGPLPPGLGKGS